MLLLLPDNLSRRVGVEGGSYAGATERIRVPALYKRLQLTPLPQLLLLLLWGMCACALNAMNVAGILDQPKKQFRSLNI